MTAKEFKKKVMILAYVEGISCKEARGCITKNEQSINS